MNIGKYRMQKLLPNIRHQKIYFRYAVEPYAIQTSSCYMLF